MMAASYLHYAGNTSCENHQQQSQATACFFATQFNGNKTILFLLSIVKKKQTVCSANVHNFRAAKTHSKLCFWFQNTHAK